MCIRFVYRGDDIITGFNFDIDPAVWDHQIITAPDRFYLGILRPDGCATAITGSIKMETQGPCSMSTATRRADTRQAPTL